MNKKDREKLLTDFILENKDNFYRLAFSYVKNKEDSLDVIQESIYKALRTIHSLNNIQGLKSWFYRIVVNTSIDLLRKQKKEVYAGDDKLEFFSPKSNDSYENVDLLKLLDELSPKYRIVIILKYFEDMTISEIAEVLQENENTVKTHLYKGLKLLRFQKSSLGG